VVVEQRFLIMLLSLVEDLQDLKDTPAAVVVVEGESQIELLKH
jgi:hypothetical protein